MPDRPNWLVVLQMLLDRLPGWPTERQLVALGTFLLLWDLLNMAFKSPELWDVEVFKVIIQAVALTGLLNMILAFHFTANKSSEQKDENLSRALEIKGPEATKAADHVIGEAAQPPFPADAPPDPEKERT